MARYKKYRYGGKRIPGMFKRQGGGEEMDGFARNKQNIEQFDSLANEAESRYNQNVQKEFYKANMNRSRGMGRAMGAGGMSGRAMNNSMQALNNAVKEGQLARTNIVNQKMTEMVMQMKLQNDSLQQQNQLLKTQIEKSDLINSARNTKQKVGADNSPKRKGGSVKAKKGKEKRIMFSQSTGATMKHGGSCGGPLMSMMKKSKRR
jgi:hypothetical protein